MDKNVAEKEIDYQLIKLLLINLQREGLLSAKLDYSRPGTPTDNAYIESFNGSFRDECLNTNWFMSLEDAREKIEKWKKDYNEFRPHSALTYLTPAEYARKSRAAAD